MTTAGGTIGILDSQSNRADILTSTTGGYRGIDVSKTLHKLYWTQVDVTGIYRSNFDGTGVQTIISNGVSFPNSIAVDDTDGFLFWGDQTLGTIKRSNLNGGPNSIKTIVTTPFHSGLIVDEENSRIYWTTSITDELGEIWTANLNGNNAHAIITGTAPFKPDDLALDDSGWIYWTDYVTDTVSRARLDNPATTRQLLYSAGGNYNPNGIQVRGGYVYVGSRVSVSV